MPYCVAYPCAPPKCSLRYTTECDPRGKRIYLPAGIVLIGVPPCGYAVASEGGDGIDVEGSRLRSCLSIGTR